MAEKKSDFVVSDRRKFTDEGELRTEVRPAHDPDEPLREAWMRRTIREAAKEGLPARAFRGQGSPQSRGQGCRGQGAGKGRREKGSRQGGSDRCRQQGARESGRQKGPGQSRVPEVPVQQRRPQESGQKDRRQKGRREEGWQENRW